MAFTPITTQEQFNEAIGKVRKADKVQARARLEKETEQLRQQILKAQSLLITQEQMLDAIRVIVREEITLATKGNTHE